jgi:hypothetical protein
MFASETALVNSALVKLGEERITSLSSDTSRRAVIANQQYPIQRDFLLRKYRWNFAIGRQALAQLADAPAFGFTYQYTLPDDCIAFIGIYDANQSRANYTATQIIHKIEAGEDATVLVCDESDVNAVYVRRVTNTRLFDSHFGEALAWLLAADLASYLSAGPENFRRCMARYKDVIKEAKTAQAFESTPEIIEGSEWVDSRDRGDGLRNMGWARS